MKRAFSLCLGALLFVVQPGIAQNKKYAGVGEVSEIILPAPASIRSNFNLFYEVHQSAPSNATLSFWYKIIFSQACTFEFTLIPVSEDDSYDFFFCKSEANYDFCKAVQEDKIVVCNGERIRKIYADAEQSEKFRANLVDIRPVQVQAGTAVYIEVFSVSGNDRGHYLDFRTTNNSFVVKVVNDNFNKLTKDTVNNINQKPLIKEDKKAMDILCNALSLTDKKGTRISSIQISGENVLIKQGLEYASYTKSESVKYDKPKQDTSKGITGTRQPEGNHIGVNKSDVSDSIKIVPMAVPEKNVIISEVKPPEVNVKAFQIKHNVLELPSNQGGGNTRLELDNTLFSLLREELKLKNEYMDDQLKEYKSKLRKAKSQEKKAELITVIKDLKEQREELRIKIAEVNNRCKEIGKLLREEKREHKTSETSLFAKRTNQNNNSIDNTKSDLVYKVQIGVYKKPVSADLFKGLTPVFEETFAGGIKYFAGSFSLFKDAQQAKEYIKKMGLTDAFVVAFYKGERISIEKAKLEEGK